MIMLVAVAIGTPIVIAGEIVRVGLALAREVANIALTWAFQHLYPAIEEALDRS